MTGFEDDIFKFYRNDREVGSPLEFFSLGLIFFWMKLLRFLHEREPIVNCEEGYASHASEISPETVILSYFSSERLPLPQVFLKYLGTTIKLIFTLKEIGSDIFTYFSVHVVRHR